MESNVVACVITGNYIPHSLILYRSLAQTNPGTRLIALILGEEDRLEAEIQEGPEWIFWNRLYSETERRQLVEKYTAFELSCATRGRFHEYLYLQSGAEKWIMLDTDMYILGSLDPIWQSLEENTLILTPHSRNPHQSSDTQVNLIRSGIYNAGFLAFKKCPEAWRAIRWFKERTEELGYASPHRQASGMRGDGHGCLFVDQIWLNFMPVFFAGVNSTGAPQWNLGHWNLEDGVLEQDELGRYLFDGHQVVVVHFSGIDLNHPEYVSTHASRYREKPNFTWAAMAAGYIEALLCAREAGARIGYCYTDQLAAAIEAAAARQKSGQRSRKQQLRKILSRLKQMAANVRRLLPRFPAR
jgi:hypothetical protein